MTLNELREIAGQHNIKVGKLKKPELVRTIQQAEGNEPCFDNGKAALCGQHGCAWRPDCA